MSMAARRGTLAAPPLVVERWLNTEQSPNLADFRGRVVAIEAFQMLCPGCVSHGIPQAQRIRHTFAEDDVVVLGLHTVFEHHQAMTPVSLAAFLHEYRVGFPVAVDRPDGVGVPRTMAAYRMRGTPTLLLIDARGSLRQHWFGQVEDLVVGAEIMRLLQERSARQPSVAATTEGESSGRCDKDGCGLDGTAAALGGQDATD